MVKGELIKDVLDNATEAVNYYLENKPDKQGYCPIELHIHCNGIKFKTNKGLL